MMTIQSLHFSSVGELESCLSEHQIDPSKWVGVTLQNLYDDLHKGECSLEIKEGKLHRRINVVSVHCFHTNHNQERFRLIEEKQILPNGDTRQRGYPFVSETMKPDESPHDAAVRALAEELQISDPELQFQPSPEDDEDKIKESTSYIGIHGRYIVYHFKTDIPSRLFRERYVELENGTETHFSWVKI